MPLRLQAQSEEGMSEHDVESRRQRLEAFFEEGSTALMYAAALGHHDVVALLVQVRTVRSATVRSAIAGSAIVSGASRRAPCTSK